MPQKTNKYGNPVNRWGNPIQTSWGAQGTGSRTNPWSQMQGVSAGTGIFGQFPQTPTLQPQIQYEQQAASPTTNSFPFNPMFSQAAASFRTQQEQTRDDPTRPVYVGNDGYTSVGMQSAKEKTPMPAFPWQMPSVSTQSTFSSSTSQSSKQTQQQSQANQRNNNKKKLFNRRNTRRVSRIRNALKNNPMVDTRVFYDQNLLSSVYPDILKYGIYDSSGPGGYYYTEFKSNERDFLRPFEEAEEREREEHETQYEEEEDPDLMKAWGRAPYVPPFSSPFGSSGMPNPYSSPYYRSSYQSPYSSSSIPRTSKKQKPSFFSPSSSRTSSIPRSSNIPYPFSSSSYSSTYQNTSNNSGLPNPYKMPETTSQTRKVNKEENTRRAANAQRKRNEETRKAQAAANAQRRKNEETRKAQQEANAKRKRNEETRKAQAAANAQRRKNEETRKAQAASYRAAGRANTTTENTSIPLSKEEKRAQENIKMKANLKELEKIANYHRREAENNPMDEEKKTAFLVAQKEVEKHKIFMEGIKQRRINTNNAERRQKETMNKESSEYEANPLKKKSDESCTSFLKRLNIKNRKDFRNASLKGIPINDERLKEYALQFRHPTSGGNTKLFQQLNECVDEVFPK